MSRFPLDIGVLLGCRVVIVRNEKNVCVNRNQVCGRGGRPRRGDTEKGGKSYPFGNFILSNYNVGSQPRGGGDLNHKLHISFDFLCQQIQ